MKFLNKFRPNKENNSNSKSLENIMKETAQQMIEKRAMQKAEKDRVKQMMKRRERQRIESLQEHDKQTLFRMQKHLQNFYEKNEKLIKSIDNPSSAWFIDPVLLAFQTYLDDLTLKIKTHFYEEQYKDLMILIEDCKTKLFEVAETKRKELGVEKSDIFFTFSLF